MGIMTNTSSLVMKHSASTVYDYATDPNNWAANYHGSGGMVDAEGVKSRIPLRFGDEWTEKIDLGGGTEYLVTWTLITVDRPRKFVFQMVNGIARPADGSGKGADGVCTIEYAFDPTGVPGEEDRCLFTRTLKCELAYGQDIPDEMLNAMAKTSGVDKYLASMQKALDKQKGSS